MKKFKQYISCLVLILMSFVAKAQSEVDMADALRTSGKIWVVIVVVMIVFIGLIIYLIGIDRKVSKLEKQLNQNNK